uniref:Deubiquitinating enzyme MINDY-3/4 conserved domain-containing protein n=1 Tax=Hyaloperonospora arabidopsidis (strain Emoy2) TaxID=559515 RepID=M4C664_HYAAE
MSILCSDDVRELLSLLWPATDAGTSDDAQRWYQQGFEFQTQGESFSLGLVQHHGGPCGVLAAVQAEILRLFLFVRHHETAIHDGVDLQQLIDREVPDIASRQRLLAEAMASLLVQCAGEELVVRVVVQVPEATYRETVVPVAAADVDRPYSKLVELLVQEMPAFCCPHGVMNFTFSVLRTKRVAAVRSEMDSPTNALTGAFGHCTQELLNLLLTGKAVSNVFDGTVALGDSGLFLQGVPQRARIGYLTQLEALRYCQVGSFYKSPQFSVWVIGSSSHFSVGFALDARLSEESASAQLYQRVHRVFGQFDPMETGFIKTESLADSLMQLGVDSAIRSSEHLMARLLAGLEEDVGLILWDEYWKIISVLLHTNDLDLALSGGYVATKPEHRPLVRSDSDIARELQRQFDAEGRGDLSSTSVLTSSLPPCETIALSQVSFDWFYYNGLGSKDGHSNGRRPQLTKCRVTLEKQAEFIGQSVPIGYSGSSGGHSISSLEEIMKTKWPDARIDWLGSPVPSID